MADPYPPPPPARRRPVPEPEPPPTLTTVRQGFLLLADPPGDGRLVIYVSRGGKVRGCNVNRAGGAALVAAPVLLDTDFQARLAEVLTLLQADLHLLARYAEVWPEGSSWSAKIIVPVVGGLPSTTFDLDFPLPGDIQ